MFQLLDIPHKTKISGVTGLFTHLIRSQFLLTADRTSRQHMEKGCNGATWSNHHGRNQDVLSWHRGMMMGYCNNSEHWRKCPGCKRHGHWTPVGNDKGNGNRSVKLMLVFSTYVLAYVNFEVKIANTSNDGDIEIPHTLAYSSFPTTTCDWWGISEQVDLESFNLRSADGGHSIEQW